MSPVEVDSKTFAGIDWATTCFARQRWAAILPGGGGNRSGGRRSGDVRVHQWYVRTMRPVMAVGLALALSGACTTGRDVVTTPAAPIQVVAPGGTGTQTTIVTPQTGPGDGNAGPSPTERGAPGPPETGSLGRQTPSTNVDCEKNQGGVCAGSVKEVHIHNGGDGNNVADDLAEPGIDPRRRTTK